MRNQIRGISSMVAPRRAFRPQTGLINRHRAIVALLLAHPSLVSANFEALLMLDSGDQTLESLKKALIDAVIRDPDLDAAAINYHLRGSDLGNVLEAVTGRDMIARLSFDPSQLSNDKASIHLQELLQLVGGKSGLFSQAGTPKNR